MRRSSVGSPTLGAEHLLLGLLREDTALRAAVGVDGTERIRSAIEASAQKLEGVSSSADLPLSGEAKRVLAYAAEEADALGSREVTTSHLVLGLLRLEKSTAAALLHENGLTLASFREEARKAESRRDFEDDLATQAVDGPPTPAAASLSHTIISFSHFIDSVADELDRVGEYDAHRRLARKSWTRKDALGHLIDWSTAHHHWIARALTAAETAGGALSSGRLGDRAVVRLGAMAGPC